jgi:hypothetical protein
MAESTKFPVYCISDIKQLVFLHYRRATRSLQIQKRMDLYSEALITSVDWDVAVLITDESRSGADADSPIVSPTRSVRDAHGQN